MNKDELAKESAFRLFKISELKGEKHHLESQVMELKEKAARAFRKGFICGLSAAALSILAAGCTIALIIF